MNADDVISYCLRRFEDVVLRQSWGERGIFYNPSERLKRGVYVLTVKEKDGENDRGSMLDRETIFRVNIGLRKETFIRHSALFRNVRRRVRWWKWTSILLR